MVDPLSSLTSQSKNDALADATLSITEIHPFSMIQIAGWPNTLSQLGKFAARYCGCTNAPKPGESTSGAKSSLLRVEPLKWWLITENVILDLPDMSDDLGVVLDLSHSRAWVRITGEKAETLLNHFLPLDLRKDSFPIGTVASTAFHHVGVTLWRNEMGYNLFIPRSFASSLSELLTESANQYRLAPA